jgi:hypothetical protein
MTRTLIALLLLLAPFAVSAAETTTTAPAAERILVPRATKSPRVDGKFGKNEWSEAIKVALADGGQASLIHDGKYLYIAMVGKKPGTTNVCARWEKNVFLLHASSGLGTLMYAQKDGKWTTPRGFYFTNRDTTDSQTGIKDRKAFLSHHNWFANTYPQIAGLEREYQIALKGKRELQLVLSFMSFVGEDELDLDAWPSTVVDGCVELDLVRGFVVDREFTFQPETWGVVVMR